MSYDPCIYVIVPLFNRFKHVPRLIKQLEGQQHCNHRLVIVDHGSERLPLEMRQGKMIYLEGTTKDWWSGAVNIGLHHILDVLKVPDSDFIMLQNDDVKFGPDLLSGLLSAQGDNPRSVVSAITLKSGTEEILDAHNLLDYWRGKHVSPLKGKPLESAQGQILQADVLKGRGVLYPIHAARSIGYIDERLHYRADPEWSYRAKKAGYKLWVIPAVAVETMLDSQEGARRKRGLSYFNDFVFSKRSTQNLYSAWIYFQDCFGPLRFFWPFSIHAARTVLVGLIGAIRG